MRNSRIVRGVARRTPDLRSISKDRRHQSRISASVKDPQHSKRLLVWCVGNEVLVARDVESQWSGGQIGTSVSDVRRGCQRAEDSVYVGEYAVSGVDVILRDVRPNLVELGERIGMKSVAAHPPDRRRSLFSRSFLKASSPSIGFTLPLLRSS